MKAHAKTAIVFLLGLFAVACSDDDPTGPTKPNDQLELNSRSFVIAEIGDTANLVAWVGDQWTKTPDLVLHEETRWLSELPVLDSDRLAEGLIVARAPGKAVLLVSAFGKGPDTVHVDVIPALPTVFSIHAPERVGDGDTITLRGYKLNELASATTSKITTSPSAPVTIYSADSATVRFGIPTLPADPTCSPGAAATKINTTGARPLVDLTVSRKREDEVVLGVGEWVRLSGPTHCVRLPAIPDAAYTVVYMDATTIERTKTGDEGVWPEAHEFRVEDRSGVRVFGTMSTPRANLAVADRGLRDHARRVTSAVSSSLSPFWAFERDKPWELGETFDAYAADGRLGKARVLGIWGKIVVAVFLPDSALWLPDDYLARLDTVMTFINNEGLPILKAALGEAHPYTSVDADQLLIVLSKFNSLQVGVTGSSQFGDVVESLIYIDVLVLSSTNYALYIFGHEIAHAWQSQYHLDTRNSPTGLSGAGDNWAQEGGATFLGYELVRHRIGIGLLDNWEWFPSIWTINEENRHYAYEVAHANGYFLEGYEASASFIRDLVTRLVAAGVPYETAIANVSQGVIEGWWGVDLFGNVRTGLTQRMRSLLDPEWHPVEAVLVWTASQALDERLESEIFTNRAFKHVADVEEVYFPNCSGGTGYGWHTQGWLITGRGVGTENTCFLKNTTALVGTLDRGMLSTFMYILDDNVGGTYQLSGEAEMPEWMLVRYR